jgi:hypothetical protein
LGQTDRQLIKNEKAKNKGINGKSNLPPPSPRLRWTRVQNLESRIQNLDSRQEIKWLQPYLKMLRVNDKLFLFFIEKKENQ